MCLNTDRFGWDTVTSYTPGKIFKFSTLKLKQKFAVVVPTETAKVFVVFMSLKLKDNTRLSFSKANRQIQIPRTFIEATLSHFDLQ